MQTSDLDYHLPNDRIATHPADPRDSARLMVINRDAGTVEDHQVRDLPGLIAASSSSTRTDGAGAGLSAGDVLVLNDSRVLPAWFGGTRASTGGKVTGLYLSSSQDAGQTCWTVMLESGGRLVPGDRVDLGQQAQLELIDRVDGGGWSARLISSLDSLSLLSLIGKPPLPPYIRRQRRASDEPAICPQDVQRYNTVYAAADGSVAAPTAGLHFTQAILDDLVRRGVVLARVTLHVGMGTFAPVRTQRLEEHPMHSESVHVPAATIEALRRARATGHKIIPVGTTTVRALESLPDPLPQTGGYAAETDLFISPGEEDGGQRQGIRGRGFRGFRFTDALMTNFHLPRSTLLAMVAALPGVGVDRLLGWYRLAIERGYRFYSYGDAMLIL